MCLAVMKHFRAAGELSVKLILILSPRLLTVTHNQNLELAIGQDRHLPIEEIKIQKYRQTVSELIAVVH